MSRVITLAGITLFLVQGSSALAFSHGDDDGVAGSSAATVTVSVTVRPGVNLEILGTTEVASASPGGEILRVTTVRVAHNVPDALTVMVSDPDGQIIGVAVSSPQAGGEAVLGGHGSATIQLPRRGIDEVRVMSALSQEPGERPSRYSGTLTFAATLLSP